MNNLAPETSTPAGQRGDRRAHSSSPAQPGPMRIPLPPNLIERGRCPFDPPPDLARMRAEGPVSQVTLINGVSAWVVTGYEQARAVLADSRLSCDRIRNALAMSDVPEQIREQMRDAPPLAGMFVAADPPDHTRYRILLTGHFSVRRMNQLGPHITEIVNAHIDAMIASGTSADLVPAFALPVPSLVICELLGVPYVDRADFQEAGASLMRLGSSIEESRRAQQRLRKFVRRLVSQKRVNPTDDVLSELIHGDPALSDDELVNIATLLLVAGHETTANMIALGVFALLEHPDQLAALRADPGAIDGAVEELLRYLSVAHLGISRVALEDIDLNGHRIPAGTAVIIALPEANRDPEHWEDPNSMRLDRHRAHHLAFGHGIHQCLGQQLARVEMTIALTELLRRLPDLRLAVAAEAVPLRTDMSVYGVYSLPVTWSR